MPERFEIYIVYKRRYINTLPFLSFMQMRRVVRPRVATACKEQVNKTQACGTCGINVCVVRCGCVVDEGATMASSSTVDDRGQLAECLAFISDLALTGDAEGGHQGSVGVIPGTCQQRDDDDDVAREATGEQPDDETVPEPADSGVAAGAGGRARWLRHRLARLRLQRQRSAPGPAALSASVDDSVSSQIQMLNSLDSQVSHTEGNGYRPGTDLSVTITRTPSCSYHVSRINASISVCKHSQTIQRVWPQNDFYALLALHPHAYGARSHLAPTVLDSGAYGA